jgi:hypothetical protein
VKRQGREELPDGAHTEFEWDDESGDYDFTEYDAERNFVQRTQRRFIDVDAPKGGLVAQDIHLDADGTEVSRTNHIRGEGPDPEKGAGPSAPDEEQQGARLRGAAFVTDL